jgi:hypothetical protein
MCRGKSVIAGNISLLVSTGNFRKNARIMRVSIVYLQEKAAETGIFPA